MSGGRPDGAFYCNARNTRLSIFAGIVFSLFFATLAFAPFGLAANIFCWALAGLSAIGAGLGIAQLLDKRPWLIVDGQGILYRNFSKSCVPWRDVESIAVVRTYRLQVRWTKADYKHQRQSDTINFSVRDLARYPDHPGRALSRKMYALAKLPPIAIQTWFLDASTEQVADAIRRYWKGEIKEVDVKTR